MFFPHSVWLPCGWPSAGQSLAAFRAPGDLLSLSWTSIVPGVFSSSQCPWTLCAPPCSLSRVSEGPAQATPTPQRNPSSPRLRITKQDNHSIHLFMAHCGAHPGLRKGTLSVGELFLPLSHSLSSLFFLCTFSWGAGGENFDAVKGHPPKLCVHYCKPPAPFSSTYQGYEEESELQSWRWT